MRKQDRISLTFASPGGSVIPGTQWKDDMCNLSPSMKPMPPVPRRATPKRSAATKKSEQRRKPQESEKTQRLVCPGL